MLFAIWCLEFFFLPLALIGHVADFLRILGFVKCFGAIGRRKDSLGQIMADFAFVDIKGCHHLDVTGQKAPNIPVHQANGIFRLFVSVIVYALYQ